VGWGGGCHPVLTLPTSISSATGSLKNKEDVSPFVCFFPHSDEPPSTTPNTWQPMTSLHPDLKGPPEKGRGARPLSVLSAQLSPAAAVSRRKLAAGGVNDPVLVQMASVAGRFFFLRLVRNAGLLWHRRRLSSPKPFWQTKG